MLYRLLYFNKVIKRDTSWDSDSGICRITGFFNLFCEFSCFLYIVFLSYIMKKMIVDPTCNFTLITLIAHFTSLGLTLAMLTIVGVFFGFGLSVICVLFLSDIDYFNMWN